MPKRRIRDATVDDVEVVQQIAVDAGMFTADDVGFLGQMLQASAREDSPAARWIVVEDSTRRVLGAAHYAPEPFADRMWNLYFIAVSPDQQGEGVGTLVMNYAEDDLRARGEAVARILIVETSSTPKYDRTRAFYEKLGYDQEARIRQFYGPQDDKIVYWKLLHTPFD